MVDEVVQSQHVTGRVQFAADGHDIVRGIHGFQNFDDDAIRWKKPSRTQAKGKLIYIDEGAGMSGEVLKVEERGGIRDYAGSRVPVRLEIVLGATAKQQFVSVYLQPLIKNGLARDEPFV